jgi:hypothetical protein
MAIRDEFSKHMWKKMSNSKDNWKVLSDYKEPIWEKKCQIIEKKVSLCGDIRVIIEILNS